MVFVSVFSNLAKYSIVLLNDSFVLLNTISFMFVLVLSVYSSNALNALNFSFGVKPSDVYAYGSFDFSIVFNACISSLVYVYSLAFVRVSMLLS